MAGTVDWGLGYYEETAARLVPAACVVIDEAAVQNGERVVDVGCGTGNAALLAAERGARVTGVDPAPRLLEVARERAAASAVDATFLPGNAADVPVGDGEADVVVSVFGAIFAPDPHAAARELARVTAPAGRIVLAAWIPGGAISDSIRVAGEAVRRALGAPAPPPPFAWHDRDALAGLLSPLGFGEITVRTESLAFTAPSPRAHLEADMANHPLAVAGRAVLESRGELQEVRDRMLAILEQGNEDPDAFRVTHRYVVAVARRG